MNRQQHPKNATTNAVRQPSQLIMLQTKKLQEIRRTRRTITGFGWAIVILLLALIHTGHKRQEAAQEATKVCNQRELINAQFSR